MKKFENMLLAALAVSFQVLAADGPWCLHVAPGGDDAGPGTLEKPLATPLGARDRIRALRQAQDGRLPPGGATVVLADGVYLFAEPLVLTRQDAGTPATPIVWRAARPGAATFSGAHELTRWRSVAEDATAAALLPPAARPHVVYAELTPDLELPGFCSGGCGTPAPLQETSLSFFEGEERRELARWPDATYARTGRNVGPDEKDHAGTFCRSGVFTCDTSRFASWQREPELWAFGLWRYEWAETKVRVLKLDAAAGTMAVDTAPIRFGFRAGARFYVFNALSELDQPGDWAIDRVRRRLYFWPKTGARTFLAVGKGLVRLEDVSDVTFEGLDFAYTRFTAIEASNAVRCVLRGVTLRHTSGWGISIQGGRDCRVAGCDLYDLGEGGIRLEGGSWSALEPCGHVADNNHVHHFGRLVPNYRPGITLGGTGCRATHNLVHHTINQAVTFSGNDHYVGYNVIHDACMFNDDAGAIYCCMRDWSRRGSVIEYNLVHMTGRPDRQTHTDAIYLDDFSSGIRVTGNIVSRASKGVHLGGGQDNTVERNLFLNCRWSVLLGSRGIDSFAKGISGLGRQSDLFKRLERDRALFAGPLWKGRYPRMMSVFDFADARHAHDAHFNRITNNVSVFGILQKDNWSSISNTCTVAGNLDLTADPGLVDYAHFDWRLKPGAARDVVGDLPIDRMGLYASPERASPPVKFGRDVSRPRPLAPVYEMATVRIDLWVPGDRVPPGVAAVATNCVDCTLPAWGKGARVLARFGNASTEAWQTYAFAFTPCCDTAIVLETMGARGEKTLYDDFRVEGAVLRDGSFEEGGAWQGGAPRPGDYRTPQCNVRRPYGVITAAEAGVAPAAGAKMGCGSDMINFSQRLELKKGVPVRIAFKARALPL